MRNPVLVGSRVYLRPAEVADAEMDAQWDAEESDTFMYRGRAPHSPIGAAEDIKTMYKNQPPEWLEFAVCLTADDTYIGHVGVYDLDWANRTGETGSFLAPGYRNQGYGPEAKHLLLEYCFDWLHLHVLRSEVVGTNTRSTAALGKQGYRLAGLIPNAGEGGGWVGAVREPPARHASASACWCRSHVRRAVREPPLPPVPHRRHLHPRLVLLAGRT